MVAIVVALGVVISAVALFVAWILRPRSDGSAVQEILRRDEEAKIREALRRDVDVVLKKTESGAISGIQAENKSNRPINIHWSGRGVMVDDRIVVKAPVRVVITDSETGVSIVETRD